MFQLAGPHMRGIGVLMVAALVLAYVAGILAGSGNVDANGELIGCDFVAFYGAGADLLAGRHDLLYDFDHQRETHQAISRNAEWDFYYPYVNPPFYAGWFVPLAMLGYVPAFAVWATVSLTAMLLSVWLIGRDAGFDRKTMTTAMILAVAFPAAFMNLAGGQNGAFSLLLLTGCVLLQCRARDWEAGMVLGFLLFKPQFVITMAVLWLFKRQWRALAGLSFVGVILVLICFVCMPTAAVDYLGVSSRLHTLIHQGSYETWKQCSWYGFFTLSMYPQWPVLLRLLTGLAAVLTFVLLLVAWRSPSVPGDRRYKVQMAATIVASVLISPHLYAYDLVVLILPGLLMAEHVLQTRERYAFSSTLVWPVLLFFSVPACLRIAELSSVQPAVLFIAAMLVVLVRMASERSATESAVPAGANPALDPAG